MATKFFIFIFMFISWLKTWRSEEDMVEVSSQIRSGFVPVASECKKLLVITYAY